MHAEARPYCFLNSKFRVSKNGAKLFFSELRQMYTNFDNFGYKNGEVAKIMQSAVTFHSSNSPQRAAVLNADVPQLLHNAVIISIRLLTSGSLIRQRAPRGLIILW